MKLIIINGMPGAGKSTLAKPLAKELDLPLISKDTIKEFLFDQIGIKDRAWSSTLGKASIDILYILAETILGDGGSLIIENAFEKSFAEPRLTEIAQKYQLQIIELYCKTDPEIRKQRFINRNESGKRHPGHVDHENYDSLGGAEAVEKFPPIGVGKLILVDTTDFVDVASLADKINKLAS